MWTRWHAEVEAYAMDRRLPMLHVYSDERSAIESAADVRRDRQAAAREGDVKVDGLTRMVSAIRELAELRAGHVSVVIVPSLDHLSPSRDGSEHTVAMLLSLHLGVSVYPIDYPESYCEWPGFTGPVVSPSNDRNASSSTPEPPEAVLLPRDIAGQVVAAKGSGSGWSGVRGGAGLTFGDLLLGLHGDPDRMPVRVPSRTPAGPR